LFLLYLYEKEIFLIEKKNTSSETLKSCWIRRWRRRAWYCLKKESKI